MQNRREFLKAAAVGATVAGLSACSLAETLTGSDERPNILWIYIEDTSPLSAVTVIRSIKMPPPRSMVWLLTV